MPIPSLLLQPVAISAASLEQAGASLQSSMLHAAPLRTQYDAANIAPLPSRRCHRAVAID
jgi:hypothetical protein